MSKNKAISTPPVSFGKRLFNFSKWFIFIYLAIVIWANWQEIVWREQSGGDSSSAQALDFLSRNALATPVSANTAPESLSEQSPQADPAAPDIEQSSNEMPQSLLRKRTELPQLTNDAFTPPPRAIPVEKLSPTPPLAAPYTPPRQWARIESSDGSANLRASKAGRVKKTLQSGWIVEIVEGSLDDDWVQIDCMIDGVTVSGFIHSSLLKPVSATELGR